MNFFPDDVECSSCKKHMDEFSSLSWNYSHLCLECVVNPFINTSKIPSTIVAKFLKEQNYGAQAYQYNCFECGGDNVLSNYDPLKKPHKTTCRLCNKICCTEHKVGVYSCYCLCPKCSSPTLTLE